MYFSEYNWRLGPKIQGEERSICQALVNCLLFQACVFDFGNEFCKQDPFPGQRKILMVNVTCLIEDETNYQQIHSSFNQVVHLKYKSKLMQVGVDLNTIDLTQTEVEINVRPEERVFGGYCNPEVKYNLLHPYYYFIDLISQCK